VVCIEKSSPQANTIERFWIGLISLQGTAAKISRLRLVLAELFLKNRRRNNQMNILGLKFPSKASASMKAPRWEHLFNRNWYFKHRFSLPPFFPVFPRRNRGWDFFSSNFPAAIIRTNVLSSIFDNPVSIAKKNQHHRTNPAPRVIKFPGNGIFFFFKNQFTGTEPVGRFWFVVSALKTSFQRK